MKALRFIFLSTLFVILGFLAGTFLQPAFVVKGYGWSPSCHQHAYSPEEVHSINEMIIQDGLEHACVVPYANGRVRVVIYEFIPWKKDRIDEKYEIVRSYLPPCEHLRNSPVYK